MNYYQAYLNPEPKIIGVNNGIYQIEIGKEEILNNASFKEFRDFFNCNNKAFWINQNSIFDLKIPVIKAKLLKKAKITDIMGYTQNITFLNNVYSSKFIEVLKQFNLKDHKTFEIKIDDVDEKYFLLYHRTILLVDINYKRSVIYTGHKVLQNVKYHSINTHEEYRKFITSNPIHSFEKICISKEYENLDFISIQAASYNFYSERLAEELINNSISGLKVSYTNSIQLEFY